ncbi:uncharacterized protein LOC128620443 [Ictalurus furcatus]|uniref:uncharacterized protein LOC128620443 n=1 Tax=Ictalurus furcatus TaxID=66913 RepID=UPI00235102D4|nr:uncharacterized protein LOC128620443 [Ictalurus furcatus]
MLFLLFSAKNFHFGPLSSMVPLRSKVLYFNLPPCYGVLLLPIALSQHTDNPIVCTSLKIFYQFRRHFKSISASTMASICNNHLFPPSFIDSTFSLWEKKGLKCFEDLFINNVFANFSELSSSFSLPPSHIFRFFQIRHCVSPLFAGFPSLPTKSAWEEVFKLNPHKGGIISRIYATIWSQDDFYNIKTISAWEEELGLELEDDYWGRALDNIRTTTSCARLSFIQFKVVHRAHLSRSKLSKIYPNVPDMCEKCKLSPCNLSHMFALCPKLQNFWNSFFETMSDVLKIKLDVCPLIAIFGVSSQHQPLNHKQASVVAFASLLARHRILLSWTPQLNSTTPLYISLA